MTDDNSANELVDIPEKLSDFKLLFEGKEPEVDSGDNEDDALANDDDTDASAETEDEDAAEEESEEDDASEESEEPDEENEDQDEDELEEEPEEDKGKRRKSNYQTRINELTRARRETERQNAELRQRLEALEAVAQNTPETKTVTVKEHLPQGAPDPNATDEKGEAKYPLGEFDPQFIFDLTQFSIETKTKEIEARRAQEAEAARIAEANNSLRVEWEGKLEKYEEEVPEIRDHIQDLVETFQNIPPQYGEYLATTIMQCENGPAIMEYLSQHIGEAQKIVASDPRSATLAIGRLEARLTKPARSSEDEKRNKKISASAPPPVKVVRGSSKGNTSVRPDTDNLADFKKIF